MTNNATRRTSRAGAYTLYVPYYTDALATESEDLVDAHEAAFGRHLQRLLVARGHELVVEMCIPHQVATMVAARAGSRSEAELEQELGRDVYAELSNSAFDAAWAEVCSREKRLHEAGCKSSACT